MKDSDLPDWLSGIESTPKNPIITLLIKFNDVLNSGETDVSVLKKMTNLKAEELMILDQTKSLQGLIEHAISRGISLEQIVKHLDWKSFEVLTSAILAASGWQSITNFRFISPLQKTSRLEFDVIAEDTKTNAVLLIDCKRYKTPSQAPIRNAVKKQKDRTYMLLNMIHEVHGSIPLKFPSWERFSLYPLILTWRNHGLQFHDKVPIVNISSFLDFLNSFEVYREMSFNIIQKF